MLSSLGFIGSGSRVLVPNVVGMSPGTAISTIEGVGLVAVSGGQTSSGATSQNNGTVASQNPVVSESSKPDLERGGSVTYVTYSYTPPPSYPPQWQDNALANFTAGNSYSDSVTASNMNYGGLYSIASGSLPSGISLNTSTGAVTGTPTSAGQSYSFTIYATNSYGTASASFSGTVGSGSGVSLGVYFDAPSSNTSLSGSIFADNTVTGATYSVSLSTSGGTISPTSFLLAGYEVKTQPFTVSGLSAGQTITVTASVSGATASNSATTTNTTPPSYTYYFEADLGQPLVPSGGELMTSGSVTRSSSGNVTVNTGSGCGTQTFFAFTSGTWYWICYRMPN